MIISDDPKCLNVLDIWGTSYVYYNIAEEEVEMTSQATSASIYDSEKVSILHNPTWQSPITIFILLTNNNIV